ncbi:hypothetical protein [Thioalkalivibrio sp. ALE19]|uniref:hypothetical protein n=1 Tax=Thioalkalivibrio sp. ALE19 TaxID=1266909 RepID=UPI0005B51497|nr:hypothetical protein [Thioalkalivibrio sp. ALE19]
MKIERLARDGWYPVSPSEMVNLEPGDIIRAGDNPAPKRITSPPNDCGNGRLELKAEPAIPSDAPVAVNLASDAVAEAMDCTCGSMTDFGDGTGILADFAATGNLYSPRLPHEELKAFCEEHIERYRAFFDANRDAVEDGNPPPMEPWWGESR